MEAVEGLMDHLCMERHPETYGGPVETVVLVPSASDFHLLVSHSTVALGHSAASVHPTIGPLTLQIFFGVILKRHHLVFFNHKTKCPVKEGVADRQ